MRKHTAAVRQALRANAPSVLLAEIQLPASTERYWSGIGNLSYDGETWQGLGGVSGISGVSSEASTYIQTVTFSVAVDEAIRAALLGDVRGGEAICWMGLLNEHAEIIPDPVEIVRIQLDTMTLTVGDGTQQVNLVGQTAFYTLEAPSRKLWTNEQQDFDYPGDTGWDRAPGNADREITWSPP